MDRVNGRVRNNWVLFKVGGGFLPAEVQLERRANVIAMIKILHKFPYLLVAENVVASSILLLEEIL